ncbi:MAG: hypothetical protein VX938_12830 [Myxococcota bacterium]|nr:hypothetical protein [Myxococcota bacterium]
MTHHRSWRVGALAVSAFALVALSPPAAAVSQQERIATGLHQKALEHFRQGEYAAAIQNWEAAEALHRHWKYAFNMALALQADEQWLRAWDACQRTQAYGLPERNLPTLNQLVEVVEGELLTEHAQITLDVTPQDANVIRNGALWQAPRTLWTKDALSDLVVSHAVHGVQQRSWPHPPGQRHTLSISLLPAPEPSPTSQGEGAEAETVLTTPEEKRTAKTDAGPEATGDDGEAVAGSITVTEPNEGQVSISASAQAPDGPPILGWVGLGSGVAALITGVVSLKRHSDLATELQTLNETPPADYATYREQFGAKSRKASTARSLGFATATGGTLILSLGAYLLLTDSGGDEGQAESTSSAEGAALAPMTLPGGAGLTLGGRF